MGRGKILFLIEIPNKALLCLMIVIKNLTLIPLLHQRKVMRKLKINLFKKIDKKMDIINNNGVIKFNDIYYGEKCLYKHGVEYLYNIIIIRGEEDIFCISNSGQHIKCSDFAICICNSECYKTYKTMYLSYINKLW